MLLVFLFKNFKSVSEKHKFMKKYSKRIIVQLDFLSIILFLLLFSEMVNLGLIKLYSLPFYLILNIGIFLPIIAVDFLFKIIVNKYETLAKNNYATSKKKKEKYDKKRQENTYKTNSSYSHTEHTQYNNANNNNNHYQTNNNSGNFKSTNNKNSISDYLKILEISQNVPMSITNDMIKKQYKKLMKLYHPDINKNGEAKAKEIVEAYEYLIKIYPET